MSKLKDILSYYKEVWCGSIVYQPALVKSLLCSLILLDLKLWNKFL